jgi:WD40 repeat protein
MAADGTATEKFVLRGHAAPVLGVVFGPESIVTASADRSLKVWSAAHGKLLRSFSASHRGDPCARLSSRESGMRISRRRPDRAHLAA